MKNLATFICLFIAVIGYSQSSIKIGQRVINGITNDPNLSAGSEKNLPTEYAVKQFVLNHLGIGWGLNGNSGINSTNFIGSTNNASLRFRTNNLERFVIDSIGNLWGNGFVDNIAYPHAYRLTSNSGHDFVNIATGTGRTELILSGNNVLDISGVKLYHDSPFDGVDAATYRGFQIQAGNSIRFNHLGDVSRWALETLFGGSEPLLMVGSPIYKRIVTIGPDTTSCTSCALKVSSAGNNQGVVFTRLTWAQANAISSPATGLLVWIIDSSSYFQYNGAVWQNLHEVLTGGADGNNFPTSISYPGGVLTIGRNGTSAITYNLQSDLDTRYQQVGSYATTTQNAAKKDNSDSTNATTGYTTKYQNSLKLNIIDGVVNAYVLNDSTLQLVKGDSSKINIKFTTPTGIDSVKLSNDSLYSYNGAVKTFSGIVTLNNILPSQIGNAGKVLQTNGTTASWGAAAGQIDSARKTMSSTITWTGTTAPSGTATNTYRWSQTGKLVTLSVHLAYSIAGTSITEAKFDLPSDLPLPELPAGFSTSSDYSVYGAGKMVGSKSPASTSGSSVALQYNGGSSYALDIKLSTASNVQYGLATIQYFAQ